MGSLPNLNDLERVACHGFEKDHMLTKKCMRNKALEKDKNESLRDKLPIFIHQVRLI